ncbi:MAG: flagellar hook-basal body protein [Lachnospiraceae bacterium]|nr:flagellar hook-basal body protein [Lachnospiraceae bacterium]
MRVVNSSLYRNYTNSMNTVQARLNKSFNKISSGRAYESAAEDPVSYYQGKQIDDQYQLVLSKKRLLTDVKSRLEQQEKGAYDIQTTLSLDAKQAVLQARTATTSDTALASLRDKLLQVEHNMVNDLQAQYQDFYIYGGNDISTPPFSLSSDGKTLTFNHKYPGDDFLTKYEMTFKDGKFEDTVTVSTVPAGQGPTHPLSDAMKEQGFMDLGYGDIRDRSTLIDTFTGGMNVLTGLTSEHVKTSTPSDAEIMEKLTKGPLGLVAGSVESITNYLEGNSTRGEMTEELGVILQDMLVSEHTTSTVYSDLGNKYNLLEKLESTLGTMTDSLQTQYKNAVGADPYESIYEMFSNQYSYNAALQVGSNLMSSSLFDFIR